MRNGLEHGAGGGVLVPPINFALVVPGVYRSGHPNKKNFGFLRQLKLKGIMWVAPLTPYPPPQGILPANLCVSLLVRYADPSYLEGSAEYRPDSMDFVLSEHLTLHRYDLSDESVSRPYSSWR